MDKRAPCAGTVCLLSGSTISRRHTPSLLHRPRTGTRPLSWRVLRVECYGAAHLGTNGWRRWRTEPSEATVVLSVAGNEYFPDLTTWRRRTLTSPNKRWAGTRRRSLAEATEPSRGGVNETTNGEPRPTQGREVTDVPTAAMKLYFLGSTTSRRRTPSLPHKQWVGTLRPLRTDLRARSNGCVNWVTHGLLVSGNVREKRQLAVLTVRGRKYCLGSTISQRNSPLLRQRPWAGTPPRSPHLASR